MAHASEQVGLLRTEKAALRAELASETERCKQQEERTLDVLRRLEASEEAGSATKASLEGVESGAADGEQINNRGPDPCQGNLLKQGGGRGGG